MSEMYYPDYLNGTLRILFWKIRDGVFFFLMGALGLLWLVKTGGTWPLTLALTFGFFTMCPGNTSVKEQWMAVSRFYGTQQFFVKEEEE